MLQLIQETNLQQHLGRGVDILSCSRRNSE
jgi:hypothetical protein